MWPGSWLDVWILPCGCKPDLRSLCSLFSLTLVDMNMNSHSHTFTSTQQVRVQISTSTITCCLEKTALMVKIQPKTSKTKSAMNQKLLEDRCPSLQSGMLYTNMSWEAALLLTEPLDPDTEPWSWTEVSCWSHGWRKTLWRETLWSHETKVLFDHSEHQYVCREKVKTLTQRTPHLLSSRVLEEFYWKSLTLLLTLPILNHYLSYFNHFMQVILFVLCNCKLYSCFVCQSTF